ncbi:hypothetical protein RF11_03837 [Thelohanellus kitauei]|uniref:Uncharacterized protein n=1 Tax=Thelohanellus kitauei TaxID=669202 RepID=A0A0C2JHY1_THEKT|nr:hypothetical protein RF11_03837 [Thelohanellus kitauei]
MVFTRNEIENYLFSSKRHNKIDISFIISLRSLTWSIGVLSRNMLLSNDWLEPPSYFSENLRLYIYFYDIKRFMIISWCHLRSDDIWNVLKKWINSFYVDLL